MLYRTRLSDGEATTVVATNRLGVLIISHSSSLLDEGVLAKQ